MIHRQQVKQTKTNAEVKTNILLVSGYHNVISCPVRKRQER
jgi:hypothetical protein